MGYNGNPPTDRKHVGLPPLPPPRHNRCEEDESNKTREREDDTNSLVDAAMTAAIVGLI